MYIQMRPSEIAMPHPQSFVKPNVVLPEEKSQQAGESAKYREIHYNIG